MAKIDDIKSQQPDSRLTSLGTTFRPGQKRIALPTSKQMSSHAGEVKEHSNTSKDTSAFNESTNPSLSINFSKLTEVPLQEIKLSTTQHNNSAQTNTLTQHNSTQINDDEQLAFSCNTNTKKSSSANSAQLDTISINQSIFSKIDEKKHPEELIKKEYSDLKTNPIKNSEPKIYSYNSAQLSTITKHNSTQQLGTTKHNQTQMKETVEITSFNPSTTRHNQAHGPTQLDTTTRHKNSNDPNFSEYQKKINNLSGTSALILSFLCKKCIDNGTNRITISYRILSELTNINFNSIPTTCKRLRNSGFFELSGPKGGAQAVRHFDLSDFTIRAFTNELINPRFPTIINGQPGTTRHTNSTQPDTWADTNTPSKLVSNINNNLLTNVNYNELANTEILDVGTINLEALSKFRITRKQIQDIFNQKLNFTTSTLQDFVDRFSIYASEPKNIKNINSIQAVFVKMAQLASKGQDPLVDIETDADRIIRERIESLKANQEMRLRQESELITLEFENWYICLSSEQRDKTSPPSAVSKSGSSTQKLILKNYFIENIWPEKRAELYGSKQATLNPNENRNQPEV